jgi:hypothetical protein
LQALHRIDPEEPIICPDCSMSDSVKITHRIQTHCSPIAEKLLPLRWNRDKEF